MKLTNQDIIELLSMRATEGLSSEQQAQLEALLAEHGLEDSDELDLAAAAAANAIALERSQGYEDAPADLKSRLLEGADRYFRDKADNVVELRPERAERSAWNWGWATAAVLAIALISSNVTELLSTTTNYETAREQLIADAEGTRVIPWATPAIEEYADVEGNVVWNDQRQEGYLLLTGMPANDPSVSQYQLWVVDPERDSNPVDGGVFDVPTGQDSVVVPIDVKLAVSNPGVFAITREQPGGVVVSKGPLLVIAGAS